jgi:PAS domain S-box-containing protein
MSDHEPVNILLVDDQPAKLLSYEVMLGELRENLIKARSAREAMEQLLKTEIAVVVTDVSMPEMDGFDLAATIRDHPRFENTAIIFVSAIQLADLDRLRGFQLGAVDYITVPVAPALLRAKVKVVAELYRKTRQLKQLNEELEQRVAERTAALAESEERLRLAAEAAKFGTFDRNLRTGAIYISPQLKSILGYAPVASLTGDEVIAHIHPGDRAARVEALRRACAQGEDGHFRLEQRIVRLDGEERWIAVRGQVLSREGVPQRSVGVWVDITERKQADQKLREVLHLTSVATEAGHVGAWHLDVETNRLTCSDELLALVGIDRSQFGGTPEAVEAVVHPDDVERFRIDRAKALAEGDRLGYDFRVVLPNGEERSLHARGHIVRRADGAAVEAYGVMLDITERKLVEQRQRRLIAECNHRMRNTLAKMGTIVELSRANATTVDELTATLNGRLNALARSHARVSRGNWTIASLSELVKDELAPHLSDTNVSVEGPDLPLIPQRAQALTMVLHELVTNAVKYGALSTADGRVTVRWQVAGETDCAHLNLVWQEADGPTVVTPRRRGFGTRLIDNIVRYELGGRVDLSWPPTGARCEVEVPLVRVARNVE